MDIHQTLSKYILTDGDALTLDLRRSHGSWLVDASGREYLDCFSQFASQPLGWNDPHVHEESHRLHAVCEHNPANSDVYCQQYAEFAAEFGGLTPDFRHHFYVSGGTLAVENALKAAFDWKAKRLGLTDEQAWQMDVIHFRQAFHGRSGYALSLTNTDPAKTDLFPRFKWSRVNNPKVTGDTAADNAATAAALQHVREVLEGRRFTLPGRVAAIIVETIQGEGGDNHFQPAFLQGLRGLADQYDAMLIFDEVQCGMGLTGEAWAYQHFGVVPDMICFGKKAQVCGFCSTGRIDEVPDNVFRVPSRINSTWGGNLTDMVRSTIFMEQMQKRGLIGNARVMGHSLLHHLSVLGLPNLRGRGLMIAFDPPDRDNFLKRLSANMLALKCGPASVRLRPHLTFGPDHVKLACEFIKDALA